VTLVLERTTTKTTSSGPWVDSHLVRLSAADGPKLRRTTTAPGNDGRGAIGTSRAHDALDQRLGLLARLRRGWDGPGSLPPSREATSTLYAAAELAGAARARIGASPHADGYILSEWERGGTWFSAEIHGDFINYSVEAADSERTWTGALSVAELSAFLRG